MKRFGIFLLEIVAALVVCLFVGIGLLMARLEQGPVPLQPYLTEIEGALRDASPGLTFKVGNAQLESNEQYRAIRMHLQNVQLFNRDKQPVGALRDVMLGFNWHNLTGLTYMPVALEMAHPKFTVTRFANGTTGFNLQEKAPDAAHAASISDLSDMLAHLPKELRHVRITDAELRYVDEQENNSFSATNGLFEFSRAHNNINGTVNLDVAAGDFKQRIQGTIYKDEKNADLSHLVIALKDFHLDQIRGFAPQIPQELKLDMPLDILITTTMGLPLKIKKIELDLTGKQGSLQYAPYYPQALPMTGLFAKAFYEPETGDLHLQSLGANIEQTTLLAVGSMTHAGNDKKIIFKGLTENVPIDKLAVYWPVGLGKNAREWVTNHVHGGTANRSAVNVALTFSPDKQVKIDKLSGRIDFAHSDLDYLPPMPPIKDITGQCRFNDQHFDVVSNSGHVFDTKISEAIVRVSNLLKNNPSIAVTSEMSGPVHDALFTVSSKPLEFTQKMGMEPDRFSGTAQTKVFLQFPLLSNLKFEQIHVKLEAKLQDLSAKNIVKDLSLTAKAMSLNITENDLAMDGDAVLADAPSHVTWHEYFSAQSPYGTVVNAKGKITPALLKGLRLPAEEYFKNSANAESHLTIDHDKTTNIAVQADLAQAEINLPEVNIQKKANTPGKLDLKLAADKNGVTTISDSAVSWHDFSIANAALKFSDANGLESATLNDIRSGRSKAELLVTPAGPNGIKAVIKADTLDLSNYWSRKKTIGEKPSTKMIDLSLHADTLFLDPQIPLKNFHADVVTVGSDLHHGVIAAETEQGGSLALQQTENNDNSRHLAAKINNAGYVLQALDITDAVHGGTLTIIGDSEPKTPSVIEGRLLLEKFSMVHAPVLARLINALSPGGLLNLLNTKGLNFSKLETNYTLPDQKTIKLSKGGMKGDSLGLSFGGTINRENSTLDLNGTIVPLEGINKFANIIPILGKLLTGINGNGIIGATYTITGPSEDPKVFVNPLSALTPGILRSIFFESSND